MTRRRTYTRPCSTAGCRETSQIEYTARRDLEGISKTWTCRHHARPNETLSPTNRETTAVLALHPSYVNGYRREDPPKLVGYFWGPEDAAKGSDGIVSGPGFWGDAKNFPPGTRLIVTARIELPDTATDGIGVTEDAEAALARVRNAVEAGPPSGTSVPGEWENGWDAAMEAVTHALEAQTEEQP